MKLSPEAEAEIRRIATLQITDLVAEDRRDRHRVRQLDDEGLASIHRESEGMANLPRVTDRGGQMWIIEISDGDEGVTFIMAFDRELRTSAVQWIDRTKGLIRTVNSLYRVDEIRSDEPPTPVCHRIAAALTKYGFGARFGTPEIFY